MRQQRGLTEGQLATRFGANQVDVQSVVRWEKGKVIPQWPNLQAYLRVLGASAKEIAICQALMPSRQAVKERSGGVFTTKGNDGDAPPAVPGSGDLLRAMRRRAGLTTTELARRMGVRVSVISKWESADGFPNQEMLGILAVAVGAYDEEIAYLKTESRSIIPIHLWSAFSGGLNDRCEDSLRECELLSATCTDFPGATLRFWQSSPRFCPLQGAVTASPNDC